MGTKRTHSEAALVHPSRQDQVPGVHSRPVKKPRGGDPVPQKQQVHASSVNAIKKHMRDVTRRLESLENLPANVRVDDERALAAYQLELAAAEEEKIRQKMIKRYHMVRFFGKLCFHSGFGLCLSNLERQKATRHLKKQRKQLLKAQSPEEVEAAKTRVHVAEVDLNYTQYCPLSEPYVGLYSQKPKSADEKEPELTDHYDVSKKPSIWAEVEKRMT